MMDKKSKLGKILILGLVLSSCFSGRVWAQNEASSSASRIQETREKAQQSLQDYRDAVAEEKQQRLKVFSQNMIETRLQSLNHALEVLQTTERLSLENKQQIENNLQNAYTGLVVLEGQTEEAGSVDALRGIVEGAVYEYRVYKVELPKNRGLRSAGMAEYVVQERSVQILDKVSLAIETYKDAGKDTTEAEGLLNDLEAKFNEMQVYIDSAQEAFNLMVPGEDTVQAETYLAIGKAELEKVKQAGMEAKQIVASIIEELKSLE